MSCIATQSGLLCLHIPKCAGESVAQYILARCSDAQPMAPPKHHCPLSKIDADMRKAFGVGVEVFQTIVAVIRDPYSRELSQWNYWLEENKRRPEVPDFKIAACRTLEEFIRHPRSNHIAMDHWKADGDLYRWWLNVDGELPDNLNIIRVSELESELPAATDPFAQREADIPHVNRSSHGPVRDYYTAGAIEAVNEKYPWTFESGWYDQWQPCKLANTA